MRLAVVFSLIIGTIAIIFAVINPLAVDINFVFFRIEGASLPLVLITTLFLGVLIGYLVSLPSRISKGRRVKKLERAAMDTGPIDRGTVPDEVGPEPIEDDRDRV